MLWTNLKEVVRLAIRSSFENILVRLLDDLKHLQKGTQKKDKICEGENTYY